LRGAKPWSYHVGSRSLCSFATSSLSAGHLLFIFRGSVTYEMCVARGDRLSKPGGSLSGGQQERLSIACAIAAQFDVVLMDEHCPALDSLSASG
jgi:ABC-type enterochelin transport system ATPase subunit